MSLSRLMKDGIGEGSTRDDHQEISNQNYDSYSRAQEVRALAGIVGKAGLTDIDLKYMDAGDSFEKKFLAQSLDENRTREETLGILWDTACKDFRDVYIKRHTSCTLEKFINMFVFYFCKLTARKF